MIINFDLIIIGNGFDLHLGLKSSFNDFFNERLFVKNVFTNKTNNLLYELIHFRFYSEEFGRDGFIQKLSASSINWMDIEKFLKEIATSKKILDALYNSYCYKESTLFPGSFDRKMIRCASLFKSKKVPSNEGMEIIHKVLKDDLVCFKNDFAEYLEKQISERPNYNASQKEFLKKILYSLPDFAPADMVQILNFNYSKIDGINYVEANIHGLLNNEIVIGYDSSMSNIDEGDVFELSKEWQKIGINYYYRYPSNNDVFKNIIFYGHSIGEQDYPYFFEVFDSCKLLDSNCNIKLYFCYSKYGNVQEQIEALTKYKMNISKMLNAYERYHEPGKQRNMIVSKLKMKKRIQLVEILDE